MDGKEVTDVENKAKEVVPDAKQETNIPEGYSYEEHANFFSWATVSFVTKVINIEDKRPLEEKDLGSSSKKMKPANLYAYFEQEWEKELKKEPKKRSLLNAILRGTHIWYWVGAVVATIAGIALTFIPTVILNVLVSDLEAEEHDMTKRWICTVALLIAPLITAMINSVGMMMTVKLGVEMKCVASEAIYRKALKLTSAAKGSTSTGQLVNLMSTDTNVLLQFTMMISIMFMIPILMVIAVVMVVSQIGVLTWVAIGLYALMLVLQFIVVGFSQTIRQKWLRATDARVKLMNEVLTGIRVIKYYCWEKPFKGKIHDIRKQELKQTNRMNYLMSTGIDVLMSIIPHLVPLVCFSLYQPVMKKPLTSSVAYTSVTLFRILQMPFAMMPMCLMLLVQFITSIKRLTNFMNLDEVDETLVERNIPNGTKVTYKDMQGNEKTVDDYDADTDAVLIRDGTFSWGNNAPCLKDISTRIKKGSLVAVVGRVGSGKTSFVSSLVGEMTKNSGVVMVNGTMSLSAQQAWLVNDTVRNNILFGKEYDEKKYKEILNVCCLNDDLKVLQGGDQCEIGDRGINVSGGQKARISLARCCYSDSDIVVMDDPIAAVDSHVGKALFHKCIHKYMAGRTRILVTNATQYLHKCDYIIVLENETISHQGTYAELKSQNIDLMALLTEEDGSSSFAARQSMNEEKEKEEKKEKEEAKGNGALTQAETKSSGRISWSVYQCCFKEFGYGLFITVIVFFTIAMCFNVASLFVLSDWSEDTSCVGEYDEDVCTQSTNHYVWLYCATILIYGVFCICRIYSILPGRIHASQSLHDELTNVVLDAPVSFHDVTPVGRVLNRFSRDITMVDDELFRFMFMFIMQFFFLLGDCINIIISTYGLMLIVIIVAFLMFSYVQKRFRYANTDFQRIEALTRTPIFSDFQSVLTGSPSIRAYAQQDRFIAGIENKLDRNIHCMMFFQWASSWLSYRSDVLVAVILFFVATISNVATNLISPGLLGVALSSATTMSHCLKQSVRMLAQTEANMNSIERIKEYVDNVKPEPPMITDVRPPSGWPSEGKIEMKNAKLRYRDGPLVMKGVNLSVNPHEKVGIVGRTGAGKSTMMIALFRITDLCDGSITIDGMNLADLGLEDVRRALCIIPQDPVLFSASVRFNIDPFNESTDDEIWSVLEQVELKDVIQNLAKGLDDDVQEGGSNFSVGERQLICMARALLKKPKILIMDEATASLDNATDSFLQQMIRKQFSACTTLTIAHRLNTIMDYDRVCVMDQGVVAEYDTPANLLNKEDSIFRGMVVAANDPNLFDMVPGCEGLKTLLKEQPVVTKSNDDEDEMESPISLDVNNASTENVVAASAIAPKSEDVSA